MQEISGKNITENIILRLKTQPVPKKFLAALYVGSDPASESFLKQKQKVAEKLGVDFHVYRFAEAVTNDDLRREVGKIARQKPCGGILIQLPLPPNFNRHYILNAVPREKDVEVLSERALGAFYTDRNLVLPPAVETVIEILNSYENTKIHESTKKGREGDFRNFEHFRTFVSTRSVAVVGLGLLIGKPIALWLMDKCKELYLLRSRSALSIIKQADLVITGVGEPGLIKPEMLKEGASMIDFGYSVKHETRNMKHKIHGDFDASKIQASSFKFHDSGFYTPTPGGTGPISVVKLFENFYKLNNK